MNEKTENCISMIDDNIPKSVFHSLRAISLMVEIEMETKPCRYKSCLCFDTCVYAITRSDGKKECLYDMVSDAISSMTEE